MADFNLFSDDEQDSTQLLESTPAPDPLVQLSSLEELEKTFIFQSDETACLDQDDEAYAYATQSRQRYDMVVMVGEGAMGQVFLARDVDLLRKVAYKKLHDKVAVDRGVLSRFLKEVQITAQLEHPNVVPVYTLEKTEDQSLAYAMKLVMGKTLKELLQEARQAYDQGQLPDEECAATTLLEHFLKVLDALAYAHNKGVIHRDLKPANIMIGRYREVYVMDWGIARVFGVPDETVSESESELVSVASLNEQEDDLEQTRAGQILGTPRYLSPEQATGRNEKLDGRSDQFTLGLILFELVTLKPAYTGKNITDLLKRVLKAEKEPFVHYQPKQRIPRELQAIINKATARKADQRYPSLREMSEDLRRYLQGKSVLAQPDTQIQATARWFQHHPFLSAGLILVLLLSGASSATWSMVQQQRSMLQLQKREHILSQFQTAVSAQSQSLNNSFMRYEILLRGLSAAAETLLQRGEPQAGPLYTEDRFATPGLAPPDFRYAPHYGKLISLEQPVFRRAPGVSESAVEPVARRLLPLGAYFQKMFLSSLGQTQVQDRGAALQKIAEKGGPLIWSYVGLEQGLHMAYPGKAGYPVSYDPRQRPWYQLSAHKQGLHWGNPYVDVQGQGLLLPCSTALYDRQGHFLGVAGVELTFQYLVDHLLHLPDYQVIQTYLLDDQGRIMVRSSDRKRKYGLRFGEDSLGQALDLPLFPQSQVVEKIKAKGSGQLSYLEDGRRILLAYYRLDALNWYYAVAVDEDDLLGLR
ncbi:hypothetical protein COW36_02215 [bacterium (Candidatus Blackallbacteria) CG17_big_fil_post_rev_8_21_14_2_50_48_46]|uniref:Protein kinase domain-containing protein n=1 Tax=bacterium (Candidatus Blackallbacteria) CG17_big_fil_post_rev_8_21_14_2_50_48_46 TaxID=2014261 RepID=A0A2M7G9X9_9BACT|nr:MAG: hypothetical protein COW64_13255 [bacterium (Candidatus Blackallbacteria) CG18_big_fil_WC_8_21_14_2_50_49_26]PIW18946.1 MAG: hypothetical protein COW36_02215 [bacterium (Candidatus Blackallbacteria) CG17_big_fil_post_rev_8_21_14_2_50_48_46]PIW44686.1 MAG: hypothetical protein COW20_23900 [bacterium (Candidatus Blackallbacteria) CG13_big_fil_rev_8_21_14_2_50_49_14]